MKHPSPTPTRACVPWYNAPAGAHQPVYAIFTQPPPTPTPDEPPLRTEDLRLEQLAPIHPAPPIKPGTIYVEKRDGNGKPIDHERGYLPAATMLFGADINEQASPHRPGTDPTDATGRDPHTGQPAAFRFRGPDPDEEGDALAEIQNKFADPPDPDDPSTKPPERELTSEEIARRAFVLSKLEAEKTLEQMLPERTLVAWRLVREIARTKTLVDKHESLEEALTPQATSAALGAGADPWCIGHPIASAINQWDKQSREREYNTASFGGPKLCLAAITLMHQGDALPPEKQARYYNPVETDEDGIQGKTYTEPGTSLLPPDVPQEWLDNNQQIKRGYDERKDEGLCLYVQILEAIAIHLRIRQGTTENRELGRLGLRGLLEPEVLRYAMPSRVLIVGMELMLVEEMLKLLVRYGHMAARERMRAKYGFEDQELESLGMMAKRRAEAITKGELEEERALMILRTEQLITRAQRALDARTEFMALKHLAIIHGLGKDEDKDTRFGDFLGVIKKVSNEVSSRQANIAAESGARSLPA